MRLTGTQTNLPWYAYIDGEDICVDNVYTTFFGGTAEQDPDDNGETSSGISTRNNPDYLGCAIPKNIGPHFKATAGSPLPNFPYFTTVAVTNHSNGQNLEVVDIDLGPNILVYPKHGFDLTRAAFLRLGGSLEQGFMITSYRIKGAAKYVQISEGGEE
jgi:hypothetical protein